MVSTIRFSFSKGSQKPVQPDSVEEPTPKIPAIDLALQLQRMLDEGAVNSRAELADHLGVSRPRVTQVLNILDLPAPVIDYLSGLSHGEKCRYTERQLRRVLTLPSEDEQMQAIEELRAAARETTVRPLRSDHGAPGKME